LTQKTDVNPKPTRRQRNAKVMSIDTTLRRSIAIMAVFLWALIAVWSVLEWFGAFYTPDNIVFISTVATFVFGAAPLIASSIINQHGKQLLHLYQPLALAMLQGMVLIPYLPVIIFVGIVWIGLVWMVRTPKVWGYYG